LSFINCWSSINVHPNIYNSCAFTFVGFHPLQHSLVDDYVLGYTLSSKATSCSYMLPIVFYYVICSLILTLNY
jgi:hypothetical protein